MCNLISSTFASDLLVTLVGSFSGVYLAIIVARFQENRNNKKLLVYFSDLIDDIIRTINNQKQKITDLTKVIKEKPLDFHPIDYVASLDFERTKAIDSNNLLKTYTHFYKKDLKEIKNAIAYIDYLGLFMKDLFSRNEKHITYTHKDQLYIKDQIENLILRMGVYLTEIEQNEENFLHNLDYIYLSPYMKRLSELTKANPFDIQICETEILSPLNTTILHELKNNIVKEEFFQLIKRAKNRIDNILFNSFDFIESLTHDFETIDQAVKHLNKVSQKIKNI
jgi:hypothetical protein